jgi:hypothetical protein
MRHRLLLSCSLLFFLPSAAGQNPSCEVDVPLIIVMPDAALVRHVPADGFIAHHGGEALAIRSVDTDTGPRRIVLVVETGKNVNQAARKVEASVLGAIVTNARAEDSFAFLTAHGPRKELPFGAPRDVLLSSIGELSLPAMGKNQSKSILDSVLEAADWLRPSQQGDSIILFTMGLGPLGESGYGRVANTLNASGIRLFGFQLGTFYAGIYSVGLAPSPGGPNGFPPGVLLPSARIDPNRETIFGLADEAGGFFLEENTEGDPQLRYQLTGGRLQQLDKFGGQLYKGIMEYYRIRLGAAPKGFTIDLTDPLRQQLPRAHVVYPRKATRCSSASQADPSPTSPG